jgi:hypothetical protein
LAAAVELRRLFPGITDNVHARECAAHYCGLAAAIARSIWRLRKLPGHINR